MADTSPSKRDRPDGLTVLVVHAASSGPDAANLRDLLKAAGHGTAQVTFTTPEDISAGGINPRDFDCVITVLDEALTDEELLDDEMSACAESSGGLIGVWAIGEESDDLHPAMRKYGARQIPWDAEALAGALCVGTPAEAQSSNGGPAARHRTTYNKC